MTLKSNFLAVGPKITPDSGCLVPFVKTPDWVNLITNLEVILVLPSICEVLLPQICGLS